MWMKLMLKAKFLFCSSFSFWQRHCQQQKQRQHFSYNIIVVVIITLVAVAFFFCFLYIACYYIFYIVYEDFKIYILYSEITLLPAAMHIHKRIFYFLYNKKVPYWSMYKLSILIHMYIVHMYININLYTINT